MTGLVIGIFLIMSAVMFAGWLYQRAVRNGGWTDVFWTYGTGLTCAVAALLPIVGGESLWRRLFIAALVLVWSLRLGTYVALRVANSKEDVRYATMRADWGDRFQARMFVLLMIQAPVTALLSIGILFAAHRPGGDFRIWDGLGVATLIISIVGETVADRQMQRFKARNTNRVCNIGLWRWSRHPNYFFEFVGWIAYPVIAIDPANGWSFLSLMSPALMYLVLRFGTGVPPLEAAMVKSKGEAYRMYQASVSPMLPLPSRRPAGNPG